MKIIENPQLVVKRKLPWFVDIFLYPLSASGIIHLAIFLFAPLLIKRVVFIDYFGILTLVLYILLIGYIFYYLAYCVFDSSKGGWRAPDINTQATMPNWQDLISQIFLILGGIAVCFWPVAVYYIFTKQTDWIFCVLLAVGIFFLPISLLRAVLFDSFDALNPILIIGSTFRTFLSYCGPVLFFCVLAGLFAKIISNLPRLRALRQIPFYIPMVLNYLFGATFIYQKIVFIYLAMAGAGLLGRFYWWHKDKLDWGI